MLYIILPGQCNCQLPGSRWTLQPNTSLHSTNSIKSNCGIMWSGPSHRGHNWARISNIISYHSNCCNNVDCQLKYSWHSRPSIPSCQYPGRVGWHCILICSEHCRFQPLQGSRETSYQYHRPEDSGHYINPSSKLHLSPISIASKPDDFSEELLCYYNLK